MHIVFSVILYFQCLILNRDLFKKFYLVRQAFWKCPFCPLDFGILHHMISDIKFVKIYMHCLHKINAQVEGCASFISKPSESISINFDIGTFKPKMVRQIWSIKSQLQPIFFINTKSKCIKFFKNNSSYKTLYMT